MSYCGWSSDWGRCDLYVYESSMGYELHVAGRRLIAEIPESVMSMPQGTPEEWVAKHVAYSDWRASLNDPVTGRAPDHLWLDLSTVGPEAGEGGVYATPGACAARMRELKDRGFNVPMYAIVALEKEHVEGGFDE